MRIYIHQESAEPHFTLAVEWPAESQGIVFELCTRFAKAYTAAHPSAPLKAAELGLVDADGKALEPTAYVAHIASDGCDLFAEKGKLSAAPSLGAVAAAAKPSASTASAAAAPMKEMTAALAPYLKAADTAFKNRSYKKAAEIYGEAYLALERSNMIGPGLPKDLALVMRRLGEIEIYNERSDSALRWLQKAVRACPTDVENRLLLSDAHWLAEEEDEAISATRSALDVMDQSKRPKKTKSVSIKLGMQLFKAGHRQEGGSLLTKLLQQDQEDQEALKAYGQAALALGQVEDALKIYLRLVVAKPDDKDIRRLLSKTLKSAEALDFLRSHLEPSPATASALAFLASTVKDFSGVKEAIALYVQCVQHVPASSSYALNLMHLHELTLDFAPALAALYAHCETNPSTTVGTISLAELSALLPVESDLGSALWKKPSAAAIASFAASPPPSALPDLPPETGAEAPDPSGLKPAGTYNETELDVLALGYTAVKVLYVAGALSCLPKLIELVESARKVKDLHLTRVRNENAYYCCIAQLMTSMPLPLPTLPPLYVVGDSHSLAPAWRTVSYAGSPHLLVPRLVTGCKIWHLREASDFFPRYNFDAAVKSIPDGAPVVFIFGEIDCREGLLVAVERMRYPDLEAGVAHTVKIYMSVLRALAASRRFKVLVHPVPPVLNETRHIVTLFNRHLRDAVKKEKSLHMLDFFDRLLTPDGGALADGLKLDGTHMHPDYTKLMEAELDKLAPVDAQ